MHHDVVSDASLGQPPGHQLTRCARLDITDRDHRIHDGNHSDTGRDTARTHGRSCLTTNHDHEGDQIQQVITSGHGQLRLFVPAGYDPLPDLRTGAILHLNGVWGCTPVAPVAGGADTPPSAVATCPTCSGPLRAGHIIDAYPAVRHVADRHTTAADPIGIIDTRTQKPRQKPCRLGTRRTPLTRRHATDKRQTAYTRYVTASPKPGATGGQRGHGCLRQDTRRSGLHRAKAFNLCECRGQPGCLWNRFS